MIVLGEAFLFQQDVRHAGALGGTRHKKGVCLSKEISVKVLKKRKVSIP